MTVPVNPFVTPAAVASVTRMQAYFPASHTPPPVTGNTIAAFTFTPESNGVSSSAISVVSPDRAFCAPFSTLAPVSSRALSAFHDHFLLLEWTSCP